MDILSVDRTYLSHIIRDTAAECIQYIANGFTVAFNEARNVAKRHRALFRKGLQRINHAIRLGKLPEHIHGNTACCVNE